MTDTKRTILAGLLIGLLTLMIPFYLQLIGVMPKEVPDNKVVAEAERHPPKINNVLEYLSFTLILSYFFVHHIFLVLIGIIFSLYLININYLNNLFRSIDKHFVIKKSTIDLNENNKIKISNSSNIESSEEDTQLTLVETIEELGFIPSVNKNDDINAA